MAVTSALLKAEPARSRFEPQLPDGRERHAGQLRLARESRTRHRVSRRDRTSDAPPLGRIRAAVHAWDSSDASDLGPHFTKVDVTDHAGVRTAAERLIWNAGRLDIVAHCAGYLGMAQPFAAHDPADWSRIVQVNLVGTMNVVQVLAPLMVARGTGVIVTFGSLAGKEGLVGLAAYSAASAGVIAFTRPSAGNWPGRASA